MAGKTGRAQIVGLPDEWWACKETINYTRKMRGQTKDRTTLYFTIKGIIAEAKEMGITPPSDHVPIDEI